MQSAPTEGGLVTVAAPATRRPHPSLQDNSGRRFRQTISWADGRTGGLCPGRGRPVWRLQGCLLWPSTIPARATRLYRQIRLTPAPELLHAVWAAGTLSSVAKAHMAFLDVPVRSRQ